MTFLSANLNNNDVSFGCQQIWRCLGVDLQDSVVSWISLTGMHIAVRTLEPCLPEKQQRLRNLLPFVFQERLVVKGSHPRTIKCLPLLCYQ